MYSRWTRSKSLELPDSGLFFFVVNSELLWKGTLFCGLLPEHQIHWKLFRIRQCNKKATTCNIGKFLNIAGCWTLGGSITTSMQVSRHNKHLILTFQGRRMIPRQRYLPETLSCLSRIVDILVLAIPAIPGFIFRSFGNGHAKIWNHLMSFGMNSKASLKHTLQEGRYLV